MSSPAPAGIGAGAFLVLSLLLPAGAAANVDIPRADGWYRWQTTSAATAADASCHTWHDGVVERCPCNIDKRR